MELLRVREAGRQFQISPLTFYKWRYSQKFPRLFCKVGKILFIDANELRKIADESREKAC